MRRKERFPGIDPPDIQRGATKGAKSGRRGDDLGRGRSRARAISGGGAPGKGDLGRRRQFEPAEERMAGSAHLPAGIICLLKNLSMVAHVITIGRKHRSPPRHPLCSGENRHGRKNVGASMFFAPMPPHWKAIGLLHRSSNQKAGWKPALPAKAISGEDALGGGKFDGTPPAPGLFAPGHPEGVRTVRETPGRALRSPSPARGGCGTRARRRGTPRFSRLPRRPGRPRSPAPPAGRIFSRISG